MMKRIKPMFAGLLLWCMFGLLLTFGFLQSAAIRQFHSVSLRYNTPISGQTAYRARQYSITNIENNPFWPTFWHECRMSFSVGARTAHANTVSFSGDASLVWPARYITGSAPSSIDSTGIAVSNALAHSLWGSTDIIGMTVYVNDKPRIVRGVFEGTADIALLSFHIEDTAQSWTAVELAGGQPNPTRSQAENFATASGLSRPDYILMGGSIALSRLMSIFPLLIIAAYGLILLAGFTKKHYGAAATLIIFAGFILFAIFLPNMLEALPPWIIPTHWSDFSFWSNLLLQANDSLREFLRVNPMLRDVELKIHLLRQIGIFIASVCSGIIVCAQWHCHIRQNDYGNMNISTTR